jgi:TupA-like ATPgrasp
MAEGSHLSEVRAAAAAWEQSTAQRCAVTEPATGWRSFWKRTVQGLRSRPRWQTFVVARLMRRRITSRLSLEGRLWVEYMFRRALGQRISERAWPRMTFNDKVVYRRLRSRNPRYATFCDKLRMREYSTDRLGPECVPRLIRVGDAASDFSDLVGPFVLKANHGSGWVTFVEEGASLTQDQLELADRWLASDFTDSRNEWGYGVARHLVYAEELLPGPPPDYKLFTFWGEPELIQVDVDRFGAHQRALMLPDWRHVEGTFVYPAPAEMPERRGNLTTMLEWARILGQDIDFVRVDLYDLGTRVLVGELSPYPEGGSGVFRPKSLDRWLGEKWSRTSSA